MIRDLDAGTPGAREADVLVIGGGTAGLVLASQLAQRGKRVLVLESGGERQTEDTHPDNAVEQRGTYYAGAEHGRFRCLGGTSTRWGGALIPMQRADLEADPDGVWPVPYDALLRHLPGLERLFGLPSASYDAPDPILRGEGGSTAFMPRLAKWPPFRLRNVAALLDREIRSAAGPEIWLNAAATHFLYSPDGRVSGVVARSPAGPSMTVRSAEVVVAAGAIETTRLLLLADRDADERLFKPHDVLGRYFHDHLSARVAAVQPFSRRRMNQAIGFRFERGGMRNLRFEPAPSCVARGELAPCFAHIGFAGEDGSGFDAVRALYRALQQRRLPSLGLLAQLLAAGPWLAEAAWWRLAQQRLLFPAKARLELHMVIAQEPRARNRILLSEGVKDRFGRPLATIDWQVGDAEIARLRQSTDRFIAFWRGSRLRELGTVHPYPAAEVAAAIAGGGGIYHPGGSTRMGGSAADGVVDASLRCFAVPNLSILATSVFPTGGGANPTIMLLLAAFELADRLSGGRGST